MRGMFGLIDFKGLVRIGEGIKDDAPGIFDDEKVGTWRDGSIPAAIAVDPIDGTTLTSKGLPGAIWVLAVSTCAVADRRPAATCSRRSRRTTWRRSPSARPSPKAMSACRSTPRSKPT